MSIELEKYQYLRNDSALLAYYKLDNANDSKNSYHLTQTGGTFVNGKFGNAFSTAGGGGDRLQRTAATGDVGNNSGSITYNMWIKLSGSDIASSYWWFLSWSSVSGKMNYNFYYDYNAGARRLTWDRGASPIGPHPLYYTTTITSTWKMFTCTFDGTTMRAYINGLEVGNREAAGDGTSDDGVGFIINANNGSFSAGVITDDVSLFTRCLSATEIKNYYDSYYISKTNIFSKGRLGSI